MPPSEGHLQNRGPLEAHVPPTLPWNEAQRGPRRPRKRLTQGHQGQVCATRAPAPGWMGVWGPQCRDDSAGSSICRGLTVSQEPIQHSTYTLSVLTACGPDRCKIPGNNDQMVIFCSPSILRPSGSTLGGLEGKQRFTSSIILGLYGPASMTICKNKTDCFLFEGGSNETIQKLIYFYLNFCIANARGKGHL